MQITHKIPNNHANGNSLTDSISYSVELMNKSEIQIKPAHISFYYYYFFLFSAALVSRLILFFLHPIYICHRLRTKVPPKTHKVITLLTSFQIWSNSGILSSITNPLKKILR